MLSIAIYADGINKRSKIVAEAMRQGLLRHGVLARIVTNRPFKSVADVAIAYGWSHKAVFQASAQFIYFDLGFWNRRPKDNPKEGSYRIAINDWSSHVNMRRGMDARRFKASGVKLFEPTARNNVVIGAMSEKGCKTQGFYFLEYERNITTKIDTNKPIVLRTKPIDGIKSVPLDLELSRAHAVVTHSSNIAVDALIHGNVVYAETGIGAAFSIKDLNNLDAQKPLDYKQRVSLLSDIAHCQYTPSEMRLGIAWDYARGILK